MSYTIRLTASATNQALLGIGVDAESGVYAGVRTTSDYWETESPNANIYAVTRTCVRFGSTDNFSYELIALRKPYMYVREGRQYLFLAYYYELHYHKKKSASSAVYITFPTSWFYYLNNVEFEVGTLANTSFVCDSPTSTRIAIFETDPATKARQIYDSV